MAEVEAFPTEGVESVLVSDDGTQALFKFTVAGGGNQVIAIPTDSLMALMELTSIASGQAQKILRADQTVKHVFPTDWWEIGRNPVDGQVIFSFRLPGGMELAFQIHRDAANRYREVLDSVLGNASAPGNETIRH